MKSQKILSRITFLVICMISGFAVHAQNSVGIGTTSPDPNAVLDLQSPTGDQGLLIPRLTTAQRTGMTLAGAQNGMLVYDTDLGQFMYWDGVALAWTPVGGIDTDWTQSGTSVFNLTDSIGIGTNSPQSQLQLGNWFGLSAIDFGGGGQYNFTGYNVKSIAGPDLQAMTAGDAAITYMGTDGGIPEWGVQTYPSIAANTSLLGLNPDLKIVLRGRGFGVNVDSPSAAIEVEPIDSSAFVARPGSDGTQPTITLYSPTSFVPIGIRPPLNAASGYTLTLPSTLPPASGDVLASDGSGNLYWTTPAAATDDWSINGNAGTFSGSNFLGTTDAMPLSIRTNNTMRMQVTTAGPTIFSSNVMGLDGTYGDINLQGAENSTAGVYELAGINFVNNSNRAGQNSFPVAKIAMATNATTGVNNGELRFYTKDGTSLSQRMVIDMEGDVGIGIASPIYPLHIRNTDKISGAYIYTNSAGANSNGLWAHNAGTTNSDKRAVYASANGANGIKRGVFTEAVGTGINYGIYATAYNGTTNWAGYFDQGNVYIGGGLQMPTGAGAGLVLTSDAAGNATWSSATGDGNGIYGGSGTLSSSPTIVNYGGSNLVFSQGSGNTYVNMQSVGGGSFAFQTDGAVRSLFSNNGNVTLSNTLYTNFSTGRVGVGITSPNNHMTIYDANAHYLQIADDITGTAAGRGVRLGVNGAGTGYLLWGETSNNFHIGTSTDNNLVKIDPDNDFVGIGTGNLDPARKLEVNSAGGWPTMRLTSSTSGAGIEFVSTTQDDWLMATWNGSLALASSTNNFTSQTDQYYFTTTSFHPWNTGSKDLGNNSQYWNDLYLANAIYLNGDPGAVGEVLTSNGAGVAYWSTPSASDNDWLGDGTGTMYASNMTDDVVVGGTFNYNGSSYSLNNGISNARTITVSGSNGTYVDESPGILELQGSSTTNGDEIGMINFIQTNSAGNAHYNFARIAATRENSNPTYSSLRFYTRIGATMNEAMVIDPNGEVGIGTNTPNNALDVIGNVEFSGDLRPNNDAGTSGEVLTSQGAGLPPVWQAASGADNDWTVGAGVMYSGTSSNNVGIGLSAPERKLHVWTAGGADAHIRVMGGISTGNVAALELGGGDVSSAEPKTAIYHYDNYTFGRGDLYFALNYTGDYTTTVAPTDVRMMIQGSTGNVGIGNTAPTERLDVTGNITGDDFYANLSNGVINAGGGVMSATINYIGDNYVAPANVNGDEDLYIGDDLEVASVAYKPGGGSWVATSDRRLKKDIVTYEEGLNELMQVKTVRYKYNERMQLPDQNKVYVGVIAQDLINVAPHMVDEVSMWQQTQEDENGNEVIINEGEKYYTVDPSAFTYMTINAVQEQQGQIEELKKENAELKAELEMIKEKLGITNENK